MFGAGIINVLSGCFFLFFFLPARCVIALRWPSFHVYITAILANELSICCPHSLLCASNVVRCDPRHFVTIDCRVMTHGY